MAEGSASVTVDDADLDVEDTDGNGIDDSGAADTDGDGTYDVYTVDWTEDGLWDQWSVDADGDGVAELVEVDVDSDGVMDEVWHYNRHDQVTGWEQDTDDDGVADQMSEDTDGDGIMDTFSYDTDGDGAFDEVTQVDDPFQGLGGTYGETEDDYWQYQEVNGLCGPTSAAMIISEQTGEFVSFEDVAQTTEELGLISELDNGEYDGVYSQSMVTVLAAYGVEATLSQGDLSTLETYLADGRDVMVALDAYETWEDGEDSGSSNHMVVVTQVDEANGVVVMNDPGRTDGASFEVPLETFVDAWADSGNQMIVTETAGVDDDGTGTDDPSTDDAPAPDDAPSTDDPIFDLDIDDFDIDDVIDLFEDSDILDENGFMDLDELFSAA